MMDGALTHSCVVGGSHNTPSSIPHGVSYKWWWDCWFTLVNFLTLVNEEFSIGHCALGLVWFGFGSGFWFGLSFFFCVCKMGLE